MTLIDLPGLPALAEGTVGHTRRGPIRHRFENSVYQWLVDVDDLPRMGWWLRPFSTFSARDHLGDPTLSIRANVEAFCRESGTEIAGDRIIMLANARIFGHTFDPLSVFWILDRDDTLVCILAEVHNTYGERHGYLLFPDDAGRTETDKAFYVSPFLTVDGRYTLQFRLGRDTVSTTVSLNQHDAVVFTATFRATLHPVSARRLSALVVKQPLLTHRISLSIRIHGAWLWLRRLPIVPRSPNRSEEVSP